jgi:hypothetical protein
MGKEINSIFYIIVLYFMGPWLFGFSGFEFIHAFTRTGRIYCISRLCILWVDIF